MTSNDIVFAEAFADGNPLALTIHSFLSVAWKEIDDVRAIWRKHVISQIPSTEDSCCPTKSKNLVFLQLSACVFFFYYYWIWEGSLSRARSQFKKLVYQHFRLFYFTKEIPNKHRITGCCTISSEITTLPPNCWQTRKFNNVTIGNTQFD